MNRDVFAVVYVYVIIIYNIRGTHKAKLFITPMWTAVAAQSSLRRRRRIVRNKNVSLIYLLPLDKNIASHFYSSRMNGARDKTRTASNKSTHGGGRGYERIGRGAMSSRRRRQRVELTI